MDLTGKRVLITGSTSGIFGLAAADMFRASGAHVAINGLTADAVSRAMREIGKGVWSRSGRRRYRGRLSIGVKTAVTALRASTAW